MPTDNNLKSRGGNAPLSCKSCPNKLRPSKQLQPMDFFLAKNPPSDLITFKEMSKIVNRSVRTIKEWAKDDDFPSAIKHRGRTIGFSRFHYEQWLVRKLDS
ncbi:helix-turn-helix transcriptional regulator [Vibrio algarum]|uniref:AlpA family phage regulatory protein n=1 Tax=Vibrio algarum TaxID=3020714 RepID=A0ABT4YSZ6_9VIBR|nr:hypothetical protein [Vibrio sp. KJ40-1]MDB1124672.1 hypothetical protein [Vibrio sp. KJ40-1]